MRFRDKPELGQSLYTEHGVPSPTFWIFPFLNFLHPFAVAVIDPNTVLQFFKPSKARYFIQMLPPHKMLRLKHIRMKILLNAIPFFQGLTPIQHLLVFVTLQCIRQLFSKFCIELIICERIRLIGDTLLYQNWKLCSTLIKKVQILKKFLLQSIPKCAKSSLPICALLSLFYKNSFHLGKNIVKPLRHSMKR